MKDKHMRKDKNKSTRGKNPTRAHPHNMPMAFRNSMPKLFENHLSWVNKGVVNINRQINWFFFLKLCNCVLCPDVRMSGHILCLFFRYHSTNYVKLITK